MANTLGVTVNGVYRLGEKAFLTVNGIHREVKSAFLTVGGVHKQCYSSTLSIEDILVDFNYTDNGNDTYTITSWKGTFNGVSSTELIIPDDPRIIL